MAVAAGAGPHVTFIDESRFTKSSLSKSPQGQVMLDVDDTSLNHHFLFPSTYDWGNPPLQTFRALTMSKEFSMAKLELRRQLMKLCSGSAHVGSARLLVMMASFLLMLTGLPTESATESGIEDLAEDIEGVAALASQSAQSNLGADATLQHAATACVDRLAAVFGA